jgi:hypothetical protein
MLALTRPEAAARLGIAAGLALAAWLLVFAALALATRPRRARPGPPSMELPGDEPPAVVNLLANGWRLGGEAVPATLLDLAARKVLVIDEIEPERFVCRAGRQPAGGTGLTPYEQRVLDHVRSLAAPDGTVACEALSTGPDEQSKGWWKRFRSAVIDDARGRGLSRDRWSGGIALLVGATALAPAALAALAVVTIPPSHSSSSSSHDSPVGAFLGLTLIAWTLLMVLPGSLRDERDTKPGRQAASRWLGLREYLHDAGSFADAPPAAVAVWDRYLAYAAALGVAATAVRALPLGSESEHEAWSAYGGRWHRVRIRYPRRIPPGYGRHPVAATLLGLLNLAVGVGAGTVAWRLWTVSGSTVVDHIRDHGLPAVYVGALVGLCVLSAGAGLWTLRSAAMLLAAVPDVVTRRDVEGQVLRIHAHSQPYLAVDDGRRPRVRAWLVNPTRLGAAGLRRGDVVRATVTPRLHHVSSLEKAPAVTRRL